MPQDEDIIENKDENDFSETAEYSPKSEFSKPRLLEEAVRRYAEARSKEMRDGYYNVKFTKEGSPIKTWVEDSRKVVVGAVTAIKMLLKPEIEEDKKSSEMIEKYETAKEECFEEWAYTEMRRDNKIFGNKLTYSKTDKKYIPKVNAIVFILDSNGLMKSVPGAWNNNVDSYFDNLLDIHDILFEELMKLIHKLNYFKPQISF